MTPRLDVEMIDIDDSFEEIRTQLQDTVRSRLPVRGEDSDEVIGVLQVRDFFSALSAREASISAISSGMFPSSRISPMRWTWSKPFAARRAIWCWSMTNTAISKA